MEQAIVVEGVGKRFRRKGTDVPSTLKEALLSGKLGAKLPEFWGLRWIYFTVAKGRTVGVIGRNGAGKSTLLRTIGGVWRPDEGSIEVHGRVGALLDLHAGLTDDLTGRENIFVAGVIAGMTRAEIQARMDDIIAFAELEQFIDEPIRIYSSGMRMRLGFAVAAHIEPEILLLDEVLAVGDAAFQRKCMDRIAEFKAAGCTIFLVSHEADAIRSLCDDVLLLSHGRAVAFGPANDVMDLYESGASLPTPNDGPPGAVAHEESAPADAPDGPPRMLVAERFEHQAAWIEHVFLRDNKGAAVNVIRAGAGLVVDVAYDAHNLPLPPILRIGIHLPDGSTCYETNTTLSGLEIGRDVGGCNIKLHIERLDLQEGEYFVDVGLFEPNWDYTYDAHILKHPFRVVSATSGYGPLNPPVRWEMSKIKVE